MTISITAFTAAADSWFHDTLPGIASGSAPNQFKKRSVSDRVIVDTSDTSITVEVVVWDIPQVLSFYIGGVYFGGLVFSSGSTKQTQSLSLPAGAKHIEIEEEGCSITGIGSAGCNIQLTPYVAPQRRVYLYGTSIDVGYNCSSTFYKGWAQRARHGIDPSFQILNDSVAGSVVWSAAHDSTARAAFVAQLATLLDGTTESRLYINRQTNDYGGATGNTWSAANYQAGLTALFAALHAAYPLLTIYTISALTRNGPAEGTANTFGNSIADYRAAGAAAVAAANVAAGATFCFNIDGTAMGSLVPLGPTDGLHPDDTGHLTLANWAIAHWFAFAPPPPPPAPVLYQVTSAGRTLRTASGKVLQFNR